MESGDGQEVRESGAGETVGLVRVDPLFAGKEHCLGKGAALRTIFEANIGQDRLAGILWHPEYHFDGNHFATPQR